jgi:hypothetical protein
MRAAAAVVAGLALAVCGCGGGGGGSSKPKSDEDQIRAEVTAAYSAFAKGDADGFCSRLTADYTKDFEDYYSGKCDAATIGNILSHVDATAKQQLEKPEIGAVKIESDGKAAYPEVNGDGLEMVKEGDTWKLDDFDLPSGE